MDAGQHLLSAVVEQVAGADTVSWELHPQQPNSATSDTVTIDLSVPSLTPEQMSDIEAQCNAHIRAARGITQLVLDGSSKGQAERQAVIEKGNLRGKLPPADVIQVRPRLVRQTGWITVAGLLQSVNMTGGRPPLFVCGPGAESGHVMASPFVAP